MKDYSSIINLEHFEPKFHQRMSIYNRSAQFAPFAALTGYEDAIIETARLTDEKIELDDGLKENLNIKLQILKEHLSEENFVTVLYFKKDNKKKGGKYLEYAGKVKNIDLINREIVFIGDFRIRFEDLIEINYELNGLRN